jgi:ribosomal protein L15
MSKALWTRFLEAINVQQPKGGKGSGSGGDGGDGTPVNKETRYGQCGSKPLHKLLGKPGNKNNCPFGELAPASAKEAAKWVLAEKSADATKDPAALCTEAKQKFG